MGRTLCLGDATIKNPEGKILAYGTETAMIITGFSFKGFGKLPPKFL